MNVKTARTLASAAAVFAMSTAATVNIALAQSAPSAKVQCFGVNSCKGQGFKSLTAAACTAQHGAITPPAGQ